MNSRSLRPLSPRSRWVTLAEAPAKNRISEYMNKSNMLRKSKHDFCKRNPSLLNLLEFFERVKSM